MLKIEYYYHSMWRLETDNTSLVLDPYDDIGYPLPRGLTADVVCSTHNHHDHNNFSLISGDFIKVNSVGDYKVGDFIITGYQTYHDKEQGAKRGENIIFKIGVAGINILHLGDLGHLLDDDLVDKIGEIDILMVPIGGNYTIDANEAKAITKKINPKILMPMHYHTGACKVDIADNHAFIQGFDSVIKIPKMHVFLNELDFTKQNIYFFVEK
ncbi:MAG TPA: MBL fold metallo-hydrolase [Candidatus Cloacimonadota bacterium]|nr:MBL fold metallo-hydrolase [Candidatus Cloacimonadota bacterium]HOQ81043.1 MBL fold metallo-hydrolase [Candidatus Cloacimonadota bacterium]